jgi:hypothetical protein
MTAPTKDEWLAITSCFHVCCLLAIAFTCPRLLAALVVWLANRTLCLSVHETPLLLKIMAGIYITEAQQK